MFTIHKRGVADVAPFAYLPMTAGESPVLGTAYKIVSGMLTKASPTDKPSYLCLGEKRMDGLVPTVRICPDMEFITASAVAVPASLIGSAVTLGADAATVTATTTGGVFTVSATDAAAASTVRGYFN